MSARPPSPRPPPLRFAAALVAAVASLLAQVVVAPAHHIGVAAARHDHDHHEFVHVPAASCAADPASAADVADAGERPPSHEHDERACGACRVFALLCQGFCGTPAAIAVTAAEPPRLVIAFAAQVAFPRVDLRGPTARGPPRRAA